MFRTIARAIAKKLKIFSNEIKKSVRAVKQKFTFRAFLFLFLGAALLLANIVLFFWSVVYAFANYYFLSVLFALPWAFLGFAASCFLLFYISLCNAAKTPEVNSPFFCDTALSNARDHKGKGRAKRILGALAIYAVIWILGICFTGYYFLDKAKYDGYVETQATIDYVITDRNRESTCGYKYSVDGESYTVIGKVEYSGADAPMVGDIVTVKYNPQDPQQLYIKGEKLVFLAFGSFFVYIGLLLVILEFRKSRFFNTKLLLAYIMLGLSAVIFLASMIVGVPQGIIQHFARHLVLHFVMIFTNVGLLMLFEGIVDIRILSKK